MSRVPWTDVNKEGIQIPKSVYYYPCRECHKNPEVFSRCCHKALHVGITHGCGLAMLWTQPVWDGEAVAGITQATVKDHSLVSLSGVVTTEPCCWSPAFLAGRR